jgi:hypothetical protein
MLGLAALLPTACDFATDGQIVADESKPVVLAGLYPVQGETIDIHARNPADGLFYPVTSATANGAQSSYFGTSWFTWDVVAALPAFAWRAGVKGSRAELRAFDGPSPIVVLPLGGAACMLDEEFAGTTLLEAQAICESTNDRSAFVYTEDYQGLPEFGPSDPIDYPKALEHDETEEIQGVASDGVSWFFANNSGTPGLVRIAITEDLGKHSSWDDALVENMPAELEDLGYDHYGDLDEYGGRVYVPVEQSSEKILGMIAQFDGDLKLLGMAELDGPKAPWVAIDPVRERLYTSAFVDVRVVDVYAMVLDEDGILVDLRLIVQRKLFDSKSQMTLQRIQGGAFSPSGSLYLVSDNYFDDEVPDGELEGGVYGFEGPTMRLETHFAIKYTDDDDEELEGIEVFPLASDVAPSITGQVHVVMLDNDTWNGDDLYFKHFGLVDDGHLPWL